tara:strand:+ start:282 stop:482 length:201 start_codon:yes stop_codon:yes gene_type:complete
MTNRSSIKQQISKPKLGSGARFKALATKLKKGGARKPKALAAYIGRKKYGKEEMAKMATKGKKRRA